MSDQGGLSPEQLSEINAMVGAGRKIEAIKRYRELSGCDLKAAKEAVERLGVGEHPEGATSPAGPLQPSGGCAGVLLCTVLCAWLVACVTTVRVQPLTDAEYKPTELVEVLRELPRERPVIELARLSLEVVRADEDFVISRFVARAKELGADAVILGEEQKRQVPGAYLPPQPGRDSSFAAGSQRIVVTALAVRYGE